MPCHPPERAPAAPASRPAPQSPRIFSTIKPLCTVLPARTPRQLISREQTSASVATTHRETEGGHFQEIPRERDGHRGHAASLNHQQQHPAIQKREQRMVCLANVRVLAADSRHPRRQFRINKCSGQRDHAAERPTRRESAAGVCTCMRNDVRIDKNSGADDAAHHDHRRVEKPQAGHQTSRRIFLVGCGIAGRNGHEMVKTSDENSRWRALYHIAKACCGLVVHESQTGSIFRGSELQLRHQCFQEHRALAPEAPRGKIVVTRDTVSNEDTAIRARLIRQMPASHQASKGRSVSKCRSRKSLN